MTDEVAEAVEEPVQRTVRGRRISRSPEPDRQPSRRTAMRRRTVAVLIVLTVLAAGYLVLFTSVLGVRSVQVSGNQALTSDEVIAAANVPHGRSMVRLNTDAIRARVAALPRVASAEVHRSWPSTVQITITERVPVAFARAADGVHLIDASAVDFAVVPTPPPGQPEVISGDEPAARAAIAVLGRIPQQLRAQVVTVNAHTAGDVVLNLAAGRQVKWGGPDESERKAAVLGPLLTRPGKVYDVSTPDLPTVQ